MAGHSYKWLKKYADECFCDQLGLFDVRRYFVPFPYSDRLVTDRFFQEPPEGWDEDGFSNP